MRLIDAEELLTAFPLDDEPSLTKSCVRMTIKHMPTIEAEPTRHGHWIYKEYCFPTAIAFYKCSVCGFTCGFDADNYCPHCGAKMDEEKKQ